ncbi:capsid cement protein [Chroococcidiopsis sp.]|uniref:capsid cement protein n=1 Tax=Chroococcidiopsis sp. TaxID=3088168 RepID=UPI003F3762C4
MATSLFHVAHKAIETRTVTLAGTATMGRAIGYDSLQTSTAGAQNVWGVATTSGIIGDRIGVVTEGSVPAEAGAAITIGQQLATDAQGRFVPATTGQAIFGKALGAVSGAGKFFEVHITREGAKT